MADYASAVDQIRAYLDSTDQTVNDRITRAAADYAEGVRLANERLSQCSDLLARGLRSEAVQLAQTEPDVLDLVRVLDFNERPLWQDTASNYGLPLPPALRIEEAQRLNEEFATNMSLDELLREHRRLALCRAPLVKRLALLRLLRREDAMSPAWAEDVRTFETARHEEVRRELAAAVRDDDAEACRGLQRELTEEEWSVPPPLDLTAEADKAVKGMAAARARVELQRLAGELSDAVVAGDLARARLFVGDIERLTPVARLPANSPLAKQLEADRGWLAGEERKIERRARFEQAVASLEAAITADRPLAEVEGLYRKVYDLSIEGGFDLPESARYGYAGYRERANRGRTLKVAALAGGLAVAGVTLLVGVTLWYVADQKKQRTALGLKEARAALADGKWADAGARLDKLAADEPAAADDPEVKKLRGELAAAVEEQEGRLKTSRRLLERYKRSDPAELTEAQWEALIKSAPPAVRDEAEDERERWEQTLKEKKNKADRTRRSMADDLSRKIAALVPATGDPDRYDAVAEAVRDLRVGVGKLAAEEKDLAAPVEKAFAALEAAAKSMAERRQLLDSLPGRLRRGFEETPPTVEEYAAGLKAYAALAPNDRRSAGFAEAAGHKDSWAVAAAWSHLFKAGDVVPAVPAKGAGLGRAVTDFVRLNDLPGRDGPGLVSRPLAERFRDYLLSRAEREAAVGELDRLVQYGWPQGKFAFAYEDRVYYGNEDERAGLSGGRNFTWKVMRNYSADYETKQFDKVSAFAWGDQAWHARVRQPLRDALPKRDDGWEEQFLAAMTVVFDAPHRGDRGSIPLDPVFKLGLLETLADGGERGSSVLAAVWRDDRQRLRDAVAKARPGSTGQGLMNQVRWWDPRDNDAVTTRNKAADALATLKRRPAALSAAVKAERERLVAAVRGTVYKPAGYLLRRPKPVCELVFAAEPAVELFTLHSTGWLKVGTVKADRTVELGPAADRVAEGWLVFSRKPAG